jgi:aminoglycoside phosphotransferase (APT) family kinase protein
MNAATDRRQDLDQNAFEEECRAGIVAWVSEHLGGEVREITRLERWRPQWKVVYEAAGESRAVLFRGNRPIAGKDDLRFEMEVMQVLEANGIKVPHIHGWVDVPKAFVMDWIETEDRAPGMLHTAIENPSKLSDERWQAMLHYMTDLAAMHDVPVEEFAHIERLSKPPKTPSEIALHAPEAMYRVGEYAGIIDTPLEFLQAWLRRNVPEHRTDVRFIAGDAGQFMSAGTDVLALLDFEIANVGDIHWDLACFRGRHPYENMGDIPALYREYERVTGKPVDLPVVSYHTVGFLQLSAIAAKFFLNPKARGGNWIEGIFEYASIGRRAYEAIAELQGLALDYDLHLPEQTIQPWEDSGLSKLMIDIDRLPTSSAFESWERDLLHAIPNFLRSYARYRGWFERETIADIERLTGATYTDLPSAEVALSAVIADNDASRDAELVPMMHRRLLRFSMIAAGTDPDDGNPLFHKLDPILGKP